ncbi:hypothetical protein BHM03_00047245, partial [Ensete ventricosum]
LLSFRPFSLLLRVLRLVFFGGGVASASLSSDSIDATSLEDGLIFGSSDLEESEAVILAQYLPSLLLDVAPGTTLPMATEMVSLATSEKLKEMDWMKNIEICELVSRDPGYT